MRKEEMQTIIYSFLSEKGETSFGEIREVVKRALRNQGKIGRMQRDHGGMVESWDQSISDHDALLVNEIVYDLICERIVTPGVNESNLELPFLHVSDKRKLNALV